MLHHTILSLIFILMLQSVGSSPFIIFDLFPDVFQFIPYIGITETDCLYISAFLIFQRSLISNDFFAKYKSGMYFLTLQHSDSESSGGLCHAILSYHTDSSLPGILVTLLIVIQ